MTVIHVDFRGVSGTNCQRCKKPVDCEFNLPSGYWHWKCWREAHPNLPRCTERQIDTVYMTERVDDCDKGWYAIIRTDDMGADCWCGPYETETSAVDAAKKKSRSL